MRPSGSSNEWFRGAFILTIAALLTKILSAVYRVPFQNIVGDVGFYIYQQVYPFYGTALVLSTYGFPVIISKYFTELYGGNHREKAYRFLGQSFLILSLLGFITFLSLYYGSNWLANEMNDPNLSLLLKVSSVAFLVFPIISVLRGYFQGMGNMVPTAVSQVGEQFIRVATILILAILFTNEGFSLYVVGSGATFGSITGGLVAIFILILFLLKELNSPNPLLSIWNKSMFTGIGKVIKLLLLQGFAVCISGMVLIFMQLGDSLNMLSLLTYTGIELETAKELKGMYDRGQPLIQLGTIVATSMSLSLVPLISSERIKANQEMLHNKIRFALKISLMIGLAASVGLLAIIQPTNEMLFENRDGSTVLAALTVTIFFSSLSLTIIAILQGLGVMFFPAAVILICFLLKYLLNHILIPSFGPMGAALATNASMAIGVLILWWRLKRLTKTPLLAGGFLFKILMGTLLMFLIIKFYILATEPIYDLINPHRLVAALQALCGVAIGGLFYLIAIVRMKVLLFDDIANLPFGSKVMFLLPKEKRSKKS